LASQEDCVHFLSFGAKHKNAVRSVWRNREFRKLFFHFFGFSADVTDSAGRSANGATFLTEKKISFSVLHPIKTVRHFVQDII
jgi:hypothetical protein